MKLQIVALTADRFRDQVAITDADVEAYFNQRQAEYRMGEQRMVRILLLDRDAARAKINVTPAEAETYYKNNIQQYTTPEQVRASHILFNTAGKDEAVVQKQAEEILKRARAGEDFAALAKQYLGRRRVEGQRRRP